MRFKKPPTYLLVLIASATYILYLSFQGQLNLYIHPRYIIFTVVMSAIGLAITVVDSHYSNNTKEQHIHGDSKLLFIPLVLLLGSALLLPASALSSATVSQRTTDAGSIVSTSESRPTSTLFAGSSKGLRITDWARLLSTNEDPSYYDNKPVKISGFAYNAELGNDTVWLARFVLTCCAVDAQPVGVPVQIENWQADFEEDTWIEAEGEFKLTQTAQGEQLVLVPESIEQIEQPSNPYAN